MARIKKRYFILGISSLIILVVLFFLSTFTKNWLVKNSEKLIGRKLQIGELHFNYFKLAVQVKDLVLYEDNQTDVFTSFSELYVNFNPWTLPSGEYSFTEIRLVNPQIQIIQNNEKFNFDSLIPKEDSIQVVDTTKNEALKFTLENIQLINGKVDYLDKLSDNTLNLKNLNLNLPLISWNNEQSDMGVDFNLGENGKVNIQATVDNVRKKYNINLTTQNIDIQPITFYLKDYFDVKEINGLLTSDLKILGDLDEVIDISLTGEGTITDFSMLDGRLETIIKASEISSKIQNINLKTFKFGFDKIEVTEPHLLFVRDMETTNLERFLLPYFRSDSISSASGTAAAEEPGVSYRIDTIKVNNGLVSIKDNALNRPFIYELNELNLTMTGLTESASDIPVIFDTKLNNKGTLTGKTVWSMVNMMNIEMKASLKRLDLLSFSPYSEYFIASPITQGWLNYEFGLKMSETKLSNTNSVKVQELEFGKRTKDTTAMKVPVRLALYLMKDANDLIKFDIPVEGNPSEPKFKLGKIIWKTFLNLMVKTALSPFKALSSIAGTNPESLEKLPFTFAQDSLNQDQRDVLSRLAGIMKKKPELILTLSQSTDPEKEKSRIAIELAKIDYSASLIPVSNEVQKPETELREDSPEFLEFIRKTVPEVDSIGLAAACWKRIEINRVDARFQSLLEIRNKLVNDFLTQNQGIPAESVQVSTFDLNNLPQELRIPQFKVEVSVK